MGYIRIHKLKIYAMNKNSTKLNKRIKSYSALAGTLVVGGVADAQVNYTDVNPDANVTTGNSYNLDLNNDATVDFVFQLNAGTYNAGTFNIYYDYAIIAPGAAGNAIDTASAGGPMNHALNDPISSALLWDATSAYQLLGLALDPPFNTYNTGNFLGTGDGYIGLKFMIGTNTHYGWVRVNLAADALSMLVKDYGYDATPNTQILAGAQPTAVVENSINTVQIFSNANGINVNMNNATVEGTILITDVLGHEVANVAVSSSSQVVSMDNATAGIYFVTVYQNGSKITKKVMVK